MRMKLTLQVIEPFKSKPSEIGCTSELVPSDQVMDKAFFEAFLIDKFSDEIGEFFTNEFEDILCDTISSISFPPKARYYLSEAYEEFTMLALIEARRIAQKYRAIYTFIDDEKNEELFKSDLNLTQLMEDWVNNRETDCQSSVDVGEAMIKGMEQFVASASWHCDWIYEGEKKRPFMWFGLNGEKPEEGWILNLEDDPDAETTWKDFWFPDDGWTNRIPDADSIFLTWMEAEVGDFLPSMEDVISTCPIEIDEADDYRALSEKIANILP